MFTLAFLILKLTGHADVTWWYITAALGIDEVAESLHRISKRRKSKPVTRGDVAYAFIAPLTIAGTILAAIMWIAS